MGTISKIYVGFVNIKKKFLKRKNAVNTTFLLWSPRDGTRTPKIIVLRDYVVLRIAV